MATSNPGTLENEPVSVRLKIATLWMATMLLYAYGDIFGFFKASQIEGVLAGEISGGIEINQGFLLAISVYIAIPSVMVFLSLVLEPSVNRWTNIALPLLYIASAVGTEIAFPSDPGESAYYLFLMAVECALLLVIVRYAWTWPRQPSA